MPPIYIQRLLAVIFLGLGGWALLFPAHVLSIVIKPEFNTGAALTTLLMGCLGAQAVQEAQAGLKVRF